MTSLLSSKYSSPARRAGRRVKVARHSNSVPSAIALVHQGYELYGSDRMFIDCALALRERWPSAHLTIVLPRLGPLATRLFEFGFVVQTAELWVLRRKNGFLGTFGRIILFPISIVNAYKIFRSHELVYVNTAVILDFLLVARLFPRRALVHVHEIPTGPAIRLIAGFLVWSRAAIIYNSFATAAAFALGASIRCAIVHNGVEEPRRLTSPSYDGARPLHILMLGRFNSWKGQDLLVKAISQLTANEQSCIQVKIVGGSFESQDYDRRVGDLISDLSLTSCCKILPFDPNPTHLYEWSDIVVVPSRRPEPFGLVAVEAMANARLVVAANHGGLAEIVIHNETGLLVRPNDEADLASAIRKLILSPEMVLRLGLNGRSRYLQEFTSAGMKDRFLSTVERLCFF